MISGYGSEKIDKACFDGFLKLTHELTGITIKPDRQDMLMGRLRRRIHALQLSGFEAYLEYVREQREEHELFVNQITTNETYFFRTPRVWDYLENTFLPAWSDNPGAPVLQIWSGASSTGEEAHSLGVLMHHFQQSHSGFDYRIHGTDIDTSVLEKATAGVYRGRSVERFRNASPEWFARYMVGDDEAGFQVLPEIRKKIQFSQFNLFKTPPQAPKFDLVLLRNVLIYFTASDQEKVMSTVFRRIKPEGVAIIGESESLNNLATDFEFIVPTIYKPLTRPSVKNI